MSSPPLVARDSSADVCEMRVTAREAVQPFRRAIERRQLEARLIAWALRELPWRRTERDEARIRRECAEILSELPPDVSEPEGKEALESTVREACAEIERRQVETERQARKASFIQQGVGEVSNYMLELNRDGEISDDEYWSSEFTADLRDAVRRGPESALTGNETHKEVRELAREIIENEIE
jgi:hypothetical protein